MEGTVVMVFGLKVDTNNFIVCIPPDKVARAQQAASSALNQPSLTLKEAQSLTEFLSLCSSGSSGMDFYALFMGLYYQIPLYIITVHTKTLVY